MTRPTYKTPGEEDPGGENKNKKKGAKKRKQTKRRRERKRGKKGTWGKTDAWVRDEGGEEDNGLEREINDKTVGEGREPSDKDILTAILQTGNRVSERLSDLLKVTQLVNGEGKI